MSGNGMLFLGVLIFIFIFWVVTGGPDKPISFSGPYLHPIDGPGQTAEPYSLGRGNNITSGITGSIGGGLSDLEKQIDDISSFGEASPYRGVVSIGRNPSGPRSTDPKEEYISVSVSRRAANTINVTGWKLESSSSEVVAVIPSGVEVPRSGSVNTVSPVVLSPGQTMVVTSGRSPIGTSFRENICTGYLGEFQSFTPDLDMSCPTASQEFSRRYNDADDDECRSFLWRVPQCSVVSEAPSELSNACENFLESLNYNSCVAEYRDDADFAGDTWRVFIGSNRELWRENHETIRLVDSEGKTVDVFAY